MSKRMDMSRLGPWVAIAVTAIVGIALVILSLIGGIGSSNRAIDLDLVNSIAAIAGIAVGATTTVIVVVGSWKERNAELVRTDQARQRVQRAERILVEITEPRQARDEQGRPSSTMDVDPLRLTALWDVTHSRIDYYHELATGQADRSFRNAQRAMAVGFVMLLAFALLAVFSTESTAGSIVVGSLGAVTAGFAAYISRTFVRSQESAATHLRAYFGQPLEFSRFLAAERMLNGMDKLSEERRAEIASQLLLALFAPAAPQDPAAASGPLMQTFITPTPSGGDAAGGAGNSAGQ